MKKIIDKYLKRTQDDYHRVVFLELVAELTEYLQKERQELLDIINPKK